MSDNYPIVGTTVSKEYDSPRFEDATITVEAIHFENHEHSWYFEEAEKREGLVGDRMIEVGPKFRGRDRMMCTVTLETGDGEKIRKHCSLARTIRQSGPLTDGYAEYRTSCMYRDKINVRYRHSNDRFERRRGSSDYEMLWELCSSDHITLEDQMEMLLDEAERLFESKMPVSM